MSRAPETAPAFRETAGAASAGLFDMREFFSRKCFTQLIHFSWVNDFELLTPFPLSYIM